MAETINYVLTKSAEEGLIEAPHSDRSTRTPSATGALQEVDEMPALRIRWLNIAALIALTVCFDIKALQAQLANIDAAKKEG